MSPSQAKQLREGRGGEEGEGRTARQKGIPTFKRDHPHKQKQIPRIPTRCGEEIGFPSGAKNGVQPKAHAPHRTPALGDHLSGTQYSLAGGRERVRGPIGLGFPKGTVLVTEKVEVNPRIKTWLWVRRPAPAFSAP